MASAVRKMHHRAKMPFTDVSAMRALYASWKTAGSNKGYGSLAALFKCGESTARDIITLRTRVLS